MADLDVRARLLGIVLRLRNIDHEMEVDIPLALDPNKETTWFIVRIDKRASEGSNMPLMVKREMNTMQFNLLSGYVANAVKSLTQRREGMLDGKVVYAPGQICFWGFIARLLDLDPATCQPVPKESFVETTSE